MHLHIAHMRFSILLLLLLFRLNTIIGIHFRCNRLINLVLYCCFCVLSAIFDAILATRFSFVQLIVVHGVVQLRNMYDACVHICVRVHVCLDDTKSVTTKYIVPEEQISSGTISKIWSER